MEYEDKNVSCKEGDVWGIIIIKILREIEKERK